MGEIAVHKEEHHIEPILIVLPVFTPHMIDVRVNDALYREFIGIENKLANGIQSRAVLFINRLLKVLCEIPGDDLKLRECFHLLKGIGVHQFRKNPVYFRLVEKIEENL